MTTLTTVGGVGGQCSFTTITKVTVAIGKVDIALAVAVGADGVGSAAVATKAAVCRVCREVLTGGCSIVAHSKALFADTIALDALLCRVAGISTGSTRVIAHSTGSIFTVEIGYFAGTLTIDTHLVAAALVAALATGCSSSEVCTIDCRVVAEPKAFFAATIAIETDGIGTTDIAAVAAVLWVI